MTPLLASHSISIYAPRISDMQWSPLTCFSPISTVPLLSCIISSKQTIKVMLRVIFEAGMRQEGLNYGITLILMMIDWINIISEMQNSRRIEGSGIIHRSEEHDYINTTYLPHDRTITSVSYYARRKKQLKRNPSSDVIINLSDRNVERSDLREHIESIFKTTKSIDPFIANYIKEIRAEPVVRDNKYANFNEEAYPLAQDEKVKVLQERYFPLQNYHNYLQDLQLKKELTRLVEHLIPEPTLEPQPLPANRHEPQERASLLMEDVLREKTVVTDKKIKGYYESRFDGRLRNERADNNSFKQLPDPQLAGDSFLRFSVSENQRVRLSLPPQ